MRYRRNYVFNNLGDNWVDMIKNLEGKIDVGGNIQANKGKV